MWYCATPMISSSRTHARTSEMDPSCRPGATLLRLRPSSGETKPRSEEHTSELQSQSNLVCRLLLEKKKKIKKKDNDNKKKKQKQNKMINTTTHNRTILKQHNK